MPYFPTVMSDITSRIADVKTPIQLVILAQIKTLTECCNKKTNLNTETFKNEY